MSNVPKKEVLEKKAEILKAIAHPTRLRILKGLIEDGPSCVGKLRVDPHVHKATISQHLTRMKAVKVIKGKRNGTQIIYSINDVYGIVDAITAYMS